MQSCFPIDINLSPTEIEYFSKTWVQVYTDWIVDCKHVFVSTIDTLQLTAAILKLQNLYRVK